MVLVVILFQMLISFHQGVSFDISPNSPVPHAEILSELLDKTIFRNYTELNSKSFFDNVFGTNNNITELSSIDVSDYLDLCVLTPENLSKVMAEARRKYTEVMRRFEANANNASASELMRRFEARANNASATGVISRRDLPVFNFLYYQTHETIAYAMKLMQQSIYGTRRRLEVTRPYRKKYKDDISYNIGIYYGILKELFVKLDSLHAVVLKMNLNEEYFLFFLFAYERVLSYHVDISYIVERMFELQSKWNKLIGRNELEGDEAGEGGGGSAFNRSMSKDQIEAIFAEKNKNRPRPSFLGRR